jgi:hypothetical protein
MSCPYLKEVVMLFCQAYPVKKMVPLERLATANPCVGGNFEECPMFRDVLTRLRAASAKETEALQRAAGRRKPLLR